MRPLSPGTASLSGLVSWADTRVPNAPSFSSARRPLLELLADRLREAGLECFPLFAALRDAFSDEEIALFRELRDRERYGDIVVARPPILLTRADLERGDFARQELLEHSLLGRISGIAAAADRIYLREEQ